MTPTKIKMTAARAASEPLSKKKKLRHSAEEVAQAIATARAFLSATTIGTRKLLLQFSMTKLDDYHDKSWDERDFRYDDERARAVIARAVSGDAAAAAVLHEVAIGQLPNLLPNLAGYVGDVLMERNKRSRPGRPSSSDRDILIYFAIEKIRERGFSRMRSSVKDPDSGCSIVARAARSLWGSMSEKNVERIWKKIQRSILP
jgi:hypothetical protein